MSYLHEPKWTDGNASMTCEEYYRLYGTLTKELIEYLLDRAAYFEEEVDRLENLLYEAQENED